MKGILGYVAIAAILLTGLYTIYHFSQTAPISKEVTTKEGLLVSSEDFNFFILKMLNQSIEFMSQRAAYDLGLNGGFMKNREVYWNYNYPQISDLRKNLENAIGSTLPSFYKKFDKIIELDGAKIIVGEQLRYFDVTGDANFSIYDETVRSRTFTNFKINSRAISSYFRLLDVARQILSDTYYNSSLNDINALIPILENDFPEFNFDIFNLSDIVFITIEDKCYLINRNDIYCLAPLHSNEPKVLKDASSTWIPYDTLKLNFKIRAAQTGNTSPSCNFSFSLNPSSGSVGAGSWVDPPVSLDVAKKGTKRDHVYLTAKAYNKITWEWEKNIDVIFDDNDKPMPYGTVMRIGTLSYTPAGNYLINVTGEGCSPYINKFATYDLSVAPSMTFFIFVNPDPVKLNKKNGYNNTTSVSVVWDSGDYKDVDLYEIEGLPAGISKKLSKNKMPPNFTSILTLNITDKSSVNLGDYNIKIKAIGGGSYVEKQFTLHIDPSSVCDEGDEEACGGGNCTGTHTCDAFGMWRDCSSRGTPCNDGLYCTNPDTCNATGNCTGSPRDCSSNNILGVATCDWIPDSYHPTWDSRNPFTSVCDEVNDKCPIGDATVYHACSKASCSADCNQNSHCSNRCTGNKLYSTYSCNSGTCDCNLNNPVCSVGSCTATCDPTNPNPCPNYCSGNTRYYNGVCDPNSCTCSYSTENCNNYNKPPIGACNDPSDPYVTTWDYRAAFTSICNPASCTQPPAVTHTCDLSKSCAGAICDATHPCTFGSCQADCTCPIITFDCFTVAGGCGNAGGNTVWSSDGDTSHAKCYKDSDMGAVKCPTVSGVQYHVLSGECRQTTSSDLQFSCPTNDPDTGASGDSVDETKVCLDYLNPGTYDWWVCNFAVNSNNETAIAICCTPT